MTYYLVDTENVGRSWSRQALAAGEGDVFILFYSRNTGPVHLELFGPGCLKGASFRFIECRTGPNAMDFQLCTELGSAVANDPDASYVILSGDKGYDPVVAYWQDRNVQVRRRNPALSGTDDVQEADVPDAGQEDRLPEDPSGACQDASGGPDAPVKVSVPAAEAKAAYRKIFQDHGVQAHDLCVYAGITCEAMRMEPSRRRLDACNRFKAKYGADDGLQRYNAMKEIIRDIALNGPYPLPEKDAGQEKAPSVPKKDAVHSIAAGGPSPDAAQPTETDRPLPNSNEVNVLLSAKAKIHMETGYVKKSIDAIGKARQSPAPEQALYAELSAIFPKVQVDKAYSVLKQYVS